MKIINSIEELRAFDSPEAWPDQAWTTEERDRRLDTAQRALVRLRRISRIPFEWDCPSGFQDGAGYTQMIEYGDIRKNATGGTMKSDILGGFCFSKYGSLYTRVQICDRSRASIDTWNEMSEALGRDYGYIRVADGILNQSYDGVFTTYRCRTWLERFFCVFYDT